MLIEQRIIRDFINLMEYKKIKKLGYQSLEKFYTVDISSWSEEIYRWKNFSLLLVDELATEINI